MARPIGGTVFIDAGGERLEVRGNVTSNIGQNVTRESVAGLDRVHGFTQRPVVPFIQCDLTEKPSFSLSAINKLDDTTVQAQLADGRSLVLRNAWHAGDPERNSEEGSLTSVRFEGLQGEEIPAT